MWSDLLKVAFPLVTFQRSYRFRPASCPDREVVTLVSTLRFHERGEIEASLNAAGFEVDEVLDAPGRAGLEWIFMARPALARGQEMPRMKVRMSSASSFGSSIAG